MLERISAIDVFTVVMYFFVLRIACRYGCEEPLMPRIACRYWI